MSAAVRGVRMNGTREAEEWSEGELRHREARANVAAQVTDLLMLSDVGGGSSVLALRVRQYVEAERAGDPAATRAAALDLSAAGAATAANLDLLHGTPRTTGR